MSAPAPSTRRIALAIGTTTAALTIAVGATAASLLGWFRPAEAPTPPTEAIAPATAPPVILVPVTPTAADRSDVQVAMVDERTSSPTDRRDHEDEREDDDDRHDDDDDGHDDDHDDDEDREDD